MNESLKLIESIQSKLLQLKEEKQNLEGQLASKNQEIDSMNKKLEESNTAYNSLQQEWERHQENEENTEGALKQKSYGLSEGEISAMMAEIDKCIALLKNKDG